jgi:hypothetical protein
VVDQFERFIAASGGAAALERNMDTLVEAIRSVVQTSDTNLLFVVRPEWFYYLLWLQPYGPSDDNIHYLKGVPIGTGSPEAAEITTRFVEVSERYGHELAQEVVSDLDEGQVISPVKLQVVGSMVEFRASIERSGSQLDAAWYRRRFTNAGDALAQYLEYLVDASPDRRVATKILVALSTRTRFRVTCQRGDLRARLFEEPEAVDACLTYLQGDGPEYDERGDRPKYSVVKDRGERIELAHDFLASMIQGVCPDAVTPRERDNVMFHFDPSRSGSISGLFLRHSTATGGALPVEGPVSSRLGPFSKFEIATLALALAVILLRTLGVGGQPWLPWLTNERPYVVGGLQPTGVDLAYFFTGVAEFAWLYYLCLIHARTFSRLIGESTRQRFLSRSVPLVALALICVAAILPEAWVACLGAAGVWYGAKLWVLSRSSQVSANSRREIRGIAVRTMANMGAIVALGVGAAFYWSNRLQHGALLLGGRHLQHGTWYHVFVGQCGVLASMFLYGVILLAPVHASPGQTSEFLGLLARTDEMPAVEKW